MSHYKQIILIGKSRYKARHLGVAEAVVCSDLKGEKNSTDFEGESRGKVWMGLRLFSVAWQEHYGL